MTHTYKVTGMTCGGCEAKVKSSLLLLPGVSEVKVSKDEQSAIITMDKHIPLTSLQSAVGAKYSITAEQHNEVAELTKGWLATYQPLLLVFVYITVMALILAGNGGQFSAMAAMNNFMGGFFLVFSFFKLLDLEGFADSYAMYDVVAKKTRAWGYVYPFVELALGLAYATGFQPVITNISTLVVMSVSIIGVLQSVISKTKIQCSCLGAVFNLPMSTVTIVEDALMIAMSAGMIFALA